MTQPAVTPERITKPIQLLGAWLAGLLSIDACFLIAASRFAVGSWESHALVVAAIANVPLFLLAVFLLQTKFRPEMQEDSFYSSYLSRKTNERVVVTKDDAQFAHVLKKISSLEEAINTSQAPSLPVPSSSQIADLTIGVNKLLPDKANIEKRMSEIGVLGYTSFGTGEMPERRVIAISKYLSKPIQREILNLARELDFAHYSVFDNVEEETEEDVLFGAYGQSFRHIAVGA